MQRSKKLLLRFLAVGTADGNTMIVCAGDWVFFRQDYRGGGADCRIDVDGVTLMDLRGST